MKTLLIPPSVFSGKYLLQTLLIALSLLGLSPGLAVAQTKATAASEEIISQPGIIITLFLIIIPVVAALLYVVLKANSFYNYLKNKKETDEAVRFAAYLQTLNSEQLEQLELHQSTDHFQNKPIMLAGVLPARDERGLLSNISRDRKVQFIPVKRKALKRPNVDPALSRLIIAFLVSATWWLLFGTSIGEYLGIKFLAPDIDHNSWFSFGRLRPVHTNAVFWGWSSLAMLGLAYYVVPQVGNVPLASLRMGWWTLLLINAAVALGSLSLMAGINNGGGEYREYIWPIQGLFALGLVLTLINFLRTVANRSTKEIYVSNWYIITAIIFTITISVVAYLPYWQNGLGETIIQGYYMHQGVGMWFMLFTLGLVYYFLPQQLNKPIYSYSLGILAFWSQILFYTVIGTHHFVFSAISWSLQTVAIVGSVGMLIPVISGTTNFVMTFRGSWNKVAGSYTLPFFIVGVIFYFTGSLQGTAEAFRYTNQLWHFTDFTVAHSHLTMYGIIAFFMWGGIYAIVPRLTGQEPPQLTIGIHFWMAFIGLLFYTVPLMLGGTLRGLMWMEGKPFIESVVLMSDFWLWRAIGGSLMWASHLVFAYNLYKMVVLRQSVNRQVIAPAGLPNVEPALISKPDYELMEAEG